MLFLQVKFLDCWAPTEQERAPSCICCQVTLTPLQARYSPDNTDATVIVSAVEY